MILNESSCNFCFLIANPPHIYSEKFDFDILPKRFLIQSESIGFGQSYPTLTRPIKFEDS